MNCRQTFAIFLLLALPMVALLAGGCAPAAAQPQTPANNSLSVEAYMIAAEQLDQAVAKLQAVYANRPEVRIAADARTSQLLVIAPQALQAEIRGKLAALVPFQARLQPADNRPPAPAKAPAQPEVARPAAKPAANPNAEAVAGPPTSVVVPVRQAGSRAFEEALKKLPQLARLRELQNQGMLAIYTVRTGDRTPAELRIDHGQGNVTLTGSAPTLAAWQTLVAALERSALAGSGEAAIDRTTVIPLTHPEPATYRRLQVALREPVSDAAVRRIAGAPVSFQPPGQQPPPELPGGQNPANQNPPGQDPNPNFGPPRDPNAPGPQDFDPPAEEMLADDNGALIGPVQIELLEGLDIIVIRGNRNDVERVTEIINQIEQLSGETQPAIEVYQLKYVNNVALLELLAEIYEQVPSLRSTRVSLTPLGKPNAVLLIGRVDGVATIIDVIKRLDQPVDPASQFQVFYLKHTAAATALTVVQEFFADRPGLGARVRVTADIRSNSLVVEGSPRDLAEVALLLKRIDTPTSSAVNELRVFPLQNALAAELAPVLQLAVTGQTSQTGQGIAGGLGGAPQPLPTQGGNTAQQIRSTMLRFMTIDAQGKRQINSGILTDVKITADPRGNALVISAPAESMELLSALVRQLDQMPAAESQIKVFTIVNGDAASLVLMLETLFGISGGTQGGGGQGFFGAGANQGILPQVSASGEGSLVALRFSVDQRTNSIVASGSSADLSVVEAILLRLDDSDVRQRQSTVYRLKNAPALDVANAINEFLRSERQVQQVVPGLISPFEQIEREVVVVPEVVSNSLIVSATPRYFAEIRKIVEELDAQPPLVMIQVMLVEVAMNNIDEFGVEIGLQDSVLFDRSVLQTITGSTAAQLVPGFSFNNQALGNNGSDAALASAGTVGTQGLTSFAVGRTNSDLGFGGLVLSASSESVSVLIRALNECRRVDVLSRPQITTLDNQPAYIQVGQRVPRITATNITQVGQVNSITLENVGLILGVTPRISPDGLVVMEIDAERSELSQEPGVPISIAANGDVLTSPIVNTTTAQTTVSALSGQTIVLGGLITKVRSEVHRRVPVLSDIPILGNAFRYDIVNNRRTELLIIMTPRVVRNELDADIIKQVESSRMSWCLADVVKLNGPSGLRSRSDEWTDGEVPTVYPDLNPQGLMMENWGPEIVSEEVLPQQLEVIPPGPARTLPEQPEPIRPALPIPNTPPNPMPNPVPDRGPQAVPNPAPNLPPNPVPNGQAEAPPPGNRWTSTSQPSGGASALQSATYYGQGPAPAVPVSGQLPSGGAPIRTLPPVGGGF